MVFSRKRKDNRSPSFILDDSPKRTKVQAQRKFAQGSNVNSPVLTPVSDIEREDRVIPEPIELLPMKRPNTEDFLTFLCFRGTPVLPPSLNFFNNASMIDTRPQTSESPSTSPKNGVILPSTITKAQGERPFIAFGVRKRADPIVVSRHMDKKRRHALALQALRRKYQEQKMAKIRAITISKLSEKVQTNKTVVRTTRSVTKSSSITKKGVGQKTKITVVATKRVKVTTRRTSTLKQPVRTNIKPKMCLRSYRGRFVQRELVNKPVKRRLIPKQSTSKEENVNSEEEQFSSDDDEPLLKKVDPKDVPTKAVKKSASGPKKTTEITYRFTRSNKLRPRRLPPSKLLVRAQNKIISPPNSPRLRSQLQRKRKIIKQDITLPVKKKVIKKVEIKRKTLLGKVEEVKKIKRGTTSVIKKEIIKEVPKKTIKKDEKLRETRETSKATKIEDKEIVKREPQKISKKEDNIKQLKKEEITKEPIKTKKEEIKENTKVNKKVVDTPKAKKTDTQVKDIQKSVKKEDEKECKPNKKDECVKDLTKPNKKEENLSKINKKVEKEIEKKQEVEVLDVKTRNLKKEQEKERVVEEKRTTREASKKKLEETKDIKQEKKLPESKVANILRESPKIAIEEKKKVESVNKEMEKINFLKDQKKSDHNKKENEKKVITKEENAKVAKEEIKVVDDSKETAKKITPKEEIQKNKLVEKKSLSLTEEDKNPLKLQEQTLATLDDKKHTREVRQSTIADSKKSLKNKGIFENVKTTCKSKEGIKLIPSSVELSKMEKKIAKDLEKILIAAKEETSLIDLRSESKKSETNKKLISPETKSHDLIKKLVKADLKSPDIIKKQIVAENPVITITREEGKKVSNIVKKLSLPEVPNTELKIITVNKTIQNDKINKEEIPIKITENLTSPTIVEKVIKLGTPIIEDASYKSVPYINSQDKQESKITPNTEDKILKQEIILPSKQNSPQKVRVQEVNDSLKTAKNLQKKICNNEPKHGKDSPKRQAADQPKISSRPTRKTKEAAAIYMEILGHKLGNDEDADDDTSIDSFPELPNVRKMEQRENELKAKAIKDKETEEKVIEENVIPPKIEETTPKKTKCKGKEDVDSIKTVKNKSTKTEKKVYKSRDESEDSDKSFIAEIKTPPEKLRRQTRHRSPKLYKSFTDTDSESDYLPIKTIAKRKSDTLNSDSERLQLKEKVLNKKCKLDVRTQDDSFDESDEEPLVKLAQRKSEENKPKQVEDLAVGKQKRECTKRPQNYLSQYSSSDEEEKYFHGFVKCELSPKAKIPKPEPIIDLLSTKDVGRRFGKEKVNMSNEQIEKWLNDSALAGMNVIKRENDEMLKFGEKIPTETSLDINISDINTEGLKNSLLKMDIKDDKKSTETTPEKYTSTVRPVSNERKTIFRKEKSEPLRNINAFSVCNESSVYAFEADNEDSISTPFRRPSRRPSSTATSRSEDDIARCDTVEKNNGKFRLPNLIRNESNRSGNKPEVTLSTDESNNSGSITVQANVEIEREVIPASPVIEHSFYIPMQPGQRYTPMTKLALEITPISTKINQIPLKPIATSTPMCPPSQTTMQKNKADTRSARASCSRSFDRMSETSEDFKYKVPSSPSASSSSSAKLYKRQGKSKLKSENYVPVNVTDFPCASDPARIVEAPVFHPTEKEFIDPLEYIEKIRGRAEKFGICRIVPPANFKPECKVLDEMRFTAYNQYVHKMMDRWGPNFRELVAIRKYLATQSINLKHPPWIGGMEIDLPRLYQTVQLLGGLKEVIEKKKWSKVSELMKIPKSAQDRVTKLDDIYCKYLLPYDTLSPDERDKLFDSVETEWAKRESKNLLKAQQIGDDKKTEEEDFESEDEDESDIECIVKGRSMALSAFYRIARNTMAMWFKSPEPTAQEAEEEFWKHVTTKQYHICVHSGSIDSGNWGYGFAVSKNSPFARHAWNLKVLTNNSGSVLRSMGPVMGLTVPTLHVGMIFSGCCWYRDPHSLPWIEYLHTGANKIWYGIPDTMSEKFHTTLLKLVPNYCLNKSLWLPSDTAMLPPNLLVDNGVSLTKTVQEPGQFVVIFPKAFTSNLCTGYVVSESVFFAPPDWLNTAEKVFEELRNSREPSMFSYERLLLNMTSDPRSDANVLKQITSAVKKMCDRELKERDELITLGVTNGERLPLPETKKKKKMQTSEVEYICEDCRWNLFCSMVLETQENAIYCLEHAINHIRDKNLDSNKCKLMYTYDSKELEVLSDNLKSLIEAKILKKASGKFTGMATLLNR